MAELLVKYFIDTSFSIGDIVVIREDGYEWSPYEYSPDVRNRHFFICKIPGVAVEDVKQYLELVVEAGTWDAFNMPSVVHKRRFNLADINIPQPLKNEIEANGYITITETQFNNFVEDKLA